MPIEIFIVSCTLSISAILYLSMTSLNIKTLIIECRCIFNSDICYPSMELIKGCDIKKSNMTCTPLSYILLYSGQFRPSATPLTSH